MAHPPGAGRPLRALQALGLKHRPELLYRLAAQHVDDAEVVVIEGSMGEARLLEMLRERPCPTCACCRSSPSSTTPTCSGRPTCWWPCSRPGQRVLGAVQGALDLCAGRPILAAIPPENLAARTIERAGAGLVVSPTDEEAFLVAAKQLLVDGVVRAAAGRSARAYAEATFDTEVITDRFQHVIERAISRSTPTPEEVERTWTRCWSPAREGSSAVTWCAGCVTEGVGRIRAVDCKPKDEWHQVFDDVENVHANLELLDACQRAADGVDDLQPGRRHGRHGLHREQQGPVHAVGARVDARVGGGS